METGRCCYCGQPLRFVAMGGMVRPLHKEGATCKAARRRTKRDPRTAPLPFPLLFPPGFETPALPHACPCGKEQTFLVRHEAGVLQFDRLDWPWQRHVCARTTVADHGLDHLRLKAGELGSSRPSLALVTASQKGWGLEATHLAAVQELAPGGDRYCLKLRGESLPPALKLREHIEPGSLVALGKNGHVNWLLTTGGFHFECLDPHALPESLGIPTEWIDPHSAQI